MEVFDYLAVIISVIVGLGLTQLLTGFGALLQAEKPVRFDWIHGAWTLLVFVYTVQWWWGFWRSRTVESWNFFSFQLVLLAPILLYILTAFAFPNPTNKPSVDLWEHFMRGRTRFFSVFAALPVVVTVGAIHVRGEPLFQPANYYRALNFALALTAARVSTRRGQAILAVLAWVVLISFITIVRLRIG